MQQKQITGSRYRAGAAALGFLLFCPLSACFAESTDSGQNGSGADQIPGRQPLALSKSNVDPGKVSLLYGKYQRLAQAALREKNFALAAQFFSQAYQEACLLKNASAMLLVLEPLAEVYESMGRPDDSALARREAEQLQARIAQSKPAPIVEGPAGGRAEDSLENKLDAALKEHDHAGARKWLLQLLARDRKRPPDTIAAEHLELYGRMLFQDGRLGEARDSLLQALRIRAGCQPADSPAVIVLQRNLARLNLALGNVAPVGEELALALKFDRAKLSPNSPDYLFDLLSLAEYKLACSMLEPARLLCQEVIDAQKSLAGQKSEIGLDQAEACSLMARICAEQSQWHEARSLAAKSLFLKQRLGAPQLLCAGDFDILARAAEAQGLAEEAEACSKTAVQLRQDQLNSQQLSQALASICQTRISQKEKQRSQ